MLLIISCQKEDDLLQQQIVEGSSVLSIVNYDFAPLGGPCVVAFTTNSSWKLINYPEWLVPDKTSGSSGTTIIKILSKANETGNLREATLEFVVDGDRSSFLTVNQEAPYLNISNDTLSFAWNDCRIVRDSLVIDKDPQIIGISSNVAWRISEDMTSISSHDVEYFFLSEMAGRNDCDLMVIPMQYNIGKDPIDVRLRLYPVIEDEDGTVTEFSSAVIDSYVIKLHQSNFNLLDDSIDIEILTR